MVQRIMVSSFAGFTFISGFICTNFGLMKILAWNHDVWFESLQIMMSGLLLIVISAKTNSILKYLDLRMVKRFTAPWLIVMLFNNAAHTQEKQSGFELKNIELGSTQMTDSDAETYRNYFALLRFRFASVDEIKLWIHQYKKQDWFGSQSLQRVLIDVAPVSWLNITAGYNQMPVGSFRLGMNLGWFHLALGGSRDAVVSRSNAILDKIDQRSAYSELSVVLPLKLRFEVTVGRGRLGDDNNLKTFAYGLSASREYGKFRFNLNTGYGERILEHFSQYYWSPEIFREIYFAPDFGLEMNSVWIYLNVSIDRILEERYTGDQRGIKNWGANGEISLGYTLGPGSMYLTARYWNSAVQQAISSYRGTSLQASYELRLNKL